MHDVERRSGSDHVGAVEGANRDLDSLAPLATILEVGRQLARERRARTRKSGRGTPAKAVEVVQVLRLPVGRALGLDPQHLAPVAWPVERPVAVGEVEADAGGRRERLGDLLVVDPRLRPVQGGRGHHSDDDGTAERDGGAGPTTPRHALQPQERGQQHGEGAPAQELVARRQVDRGHRVEHAQQRGPGGVARGPAPAHRPERDRGGERDQQCGPAEDDDPRPGVHSGVGDPNVGEGLQSLRDARAQLSPSAGQKQAYRHPGGHQRGGAGHEHDARCRGVPRGARERHQGAQDEPGEGGDSDRREHPPPTPVLHEQRPVQRTERRQRHERGEPGRARLQQRPRAARAVRAAGRRPTPASALMSSRPASPSPPPRRGDGNRPARARSRGSPATVRDLGPARRLARDHEDAPSRHPLERRAGRAPAPRRCDVDHGPVRSPAAARRGGAPPPRRARAARARAGQPARSALEARRAALAGQQHARSRRARASCSASEAAARTAASRSSSPARCAGSSTTSGRAVAVGLQPALEQPGAAGQRAASGCARRACPRGSGAAPSISTSAAPRPAAAGAPARPPSRPAPGARTGSVRGSTSTSPASRRSPPARAGEAERVADDDARRLEQAPPAPRERASMRIRDAPAPGGAAAPGSPSSGSSTSPAGSGSGAGRASMRTRSGSSSTTRARAERALHARAARGQRDPRGATRGRAATKATPGDVQRLGVEAAARQRQHQAERDGGGERGAHARGRSQRRGRRDRVGDDWRAPAASAASGASTRRWASTGWASAWTSSGSAWSRPSSSARALAARSSIRPARGLAPSSTRGSARVCPSRETT